MGGEKFYKKWMVVYRDNQYYGFNIIGYNGFDNGKRYSQWRIIKLGRQN